jgi:hypothetical protein
MIDFCDSPEICRYVDHKWHIDPSLWANCTLQTEIPYRAIGVGLVGFTRKRNIDSVCIPTSHYDVEILMESGYCEKVGIDILGLY